MNHVQVDAPVRPEAGAWLLAQKDRVKLIGQLSKSAPSDRGFPRNGTPDDVKARLSAMHAEGDISVALEDAENGLALPVTPRERLPKLASARSRSLASLSAAGGRKPAYLQQFVQRGSPKRLLEIERRHLAIVLEVDERELGARSVDAADGRWLMGHYDKSWDARSVSRNYTYPALTSVIGGFLTLAWIVLTNVRSGKVPPGIEKS